MNGLAPHDPNARPEAPAPASVASKASRALSALRLCVFDTETTGLDTEVDRVVQFGTATFQNGALLSLQDTLVNPCQPIPTEASDVHKIFDSDVEDAQTFGLLGDAVAQALSQADDTILCGFNALHYDVPLLNAEFERHCYEFRIDPSRVLDPLVWLQYYYRDWPSRRLAAVATRMGIPLTDAHRASADAEATGHVLYRLIEQGVIPDNVEEALAAQAQIQGARAGDGRVQPLPVRRPRVFDAPARRHWQARREAAARRAHVLSAVDAAAAGPAAPRGLGDQSLRLTTLSLYKRKLQEPIFKKLGSRLGVE